MWLCTKKIPREWTDTFEEFFKRIYIFTKAAFLGYQQQNKSEDIITEISFMLLTNRK